MVVLSIPAIALYEACAAVFRTMNNAKITMKAALIMNLINGFGDALFIYGFQMGTRGAAFATVLSRWTAALILLVFLLNEKLPLSLEHHFCHRFDYAILKKILLVGVPGGIENGLFQMGKIAILSLVATNDTICIENGLSVVENPKPHGKSYNKWLGEQTKPSHREQLRTMIDQALEQKPKDFDELLKLLAGKGCEVSRRGLYRI